jgi:hypothetical protein
MDGVTRRSHHLFNTKQKHKRPYSSVWCALVLRSASISLPFQTWNTRTAPAHAALMVFPLGVIWPTPPQRLFKIAQARRWPSRTGTPGFWGLKILIHWQACTLVFGYGPNFSHFSYCQCVLIEPTSGNILDTTGLHGVAYISLSLGATAYISYTSISHFLHEHFNTTKWY